MNSLLGTIESRNSADGAEGFDALVTFGFTTIDRRETAQEAIRVIRRDFPSARIVVVDQNRETSAAREFYESYNVDVFYVDYDIGLSAARNLLFRSCETPYFFMLDDDVVEIPTKEMRASLDVIRADGRVLVVGGRYAKISVQQDGTKIRKINPPFNYLIERRPEANLAIFFDHSLLEGMSLPPYDRDDRYRVSDIVENFALFNVAKYNNVGLQWDERLKIVSEHLDFYINAKEKIAGDQDVLIVSNPRMIAYDIDANTASNMDRYVQKRYRHSFREFYSKKWMVGAEIHLGKWINIHRDDGHDAVKWHQLEAFGTKQKSLYFREGNLITERYGNYPVGSKRLSFIATTLDRFDAIQALAVSIRSRWADAVDIIFGIQADELPDGFAEFADALSVRLVPMGYDLGLSAARNLLVEAIDTEYFVLCDDDFVIDGEVNLGNAIRLLDDEPEVAGVGGYCRDVIYDQRMNYQSQIDRHFTFQAFYDRNSGTLVRVPFYHLPFFTCFDRDRAAMPVDILPNMAIFRTIEFGKDGMSWDERMKITGEHLDFYMQNMRGEKRQFLFDPSFSMLHNRVQNPAYTAKRLRKDGIELFYKKWDVRHEVDSELGSRSILSGETRWRPFKSAL